jgi:hypothetical protein
MYRACHELEPAVFPLIAILSRILRIYLDNDLKPMQFSYFHLTSNLDQ